MKEETLRGKKIQSWQTLLQEKEPGLRLLAVARLSRLASLEMNQRLPEEALEALLACLKDENVHVRKMAALGLGELALPLEQIVPALIEVLADNDNGVRRRAGVALSEILASHAQAWNLVQTGLSHHVSAIRQQLLGILAASQDRRAA